MKHFFSLHLICASTLAMLLSEIAMAEEASTFKKFRFEEDYSTISKEPSDTRWFSQWKNISLSDDGNHRLSLGGEMRQRYENLTSPEFDKEGQDKRGAWLHRYTLHADYWFADQLRVFGQLSSALEAGREEDPSPVEDNSLEFQNLFFEANWLKSDERTLNTRIGRQEMEFGTGRLIDVREGTTVRRSFYAAKANYTEQDVSISAFYGRPVLSKPEAFDDSTDNGQLLWGLYGVFTDLISVSNVDLYYLKYEADEKRYGQGSAEESRHSIGARFWGEHERWSWNSEVVYQWGDFGQSDIRAWTVAAEMAYSWHDTMFQPEFKLSVNAASGDDDPFDNDLKTFNPLFPRGNYFSQAAVVGPRNFYNIHPHIILHPTEKLEIVADLNFYWRQEESDALYSPAGQIIRSGQNSDESFVGTAVSFESAYQWSEHLTFTAIYTHFFASDFIKETGSSEDIKFLELTAQIKF